MATIPIFPAFLIYGDEAQAEPHKWDAMGLRGNQSGSLLVDGVVVPPQRMVGPIGDGVASNDEIVDPFFLLCSSACWNGIALGAIDIAKKHVTRKKTCRCRHASSRLSHHSRLLWRSDYRH